MKTYTIYICSNDETLTDGQFLGVGSDLRDEANEIFSAGSAVVRDDSRVDYEAAGFFQDWHGGKHRRAGSVIAGTTYGYSAGLVVTHEENPPQWLCDLCDRAAQAMSEKAAELGVAQSNDLAKSVIEDIDNGEQPSQFVIDNLSRDEVEPELLARMEAAIATLVNED